MGFPIRKFTDQSLFAAPHDLSQRTTSFIASQRQGIHQIPLRHLIALIAKARVARRISRSENQRIPISVLSDFRRLALKRPVLLQTHPGSLSGQAPNPRLVARDRTTENGDGDRDIVRSRQFRRGLPALDRMRFLFTMSDIQRTGRRRITILAPAFSLLNARTQRQGETDQIASEGKPPRRLRRPPQVLVEPDGIEPTTSCLQSTRSPN